MNVVRTISFLVSIAVVVTAFAAEPASETSDLATRLSGKWLLNKVKSDGFDNLAPQGGRGSGRGGDMGRSGGMRGGRGGGRSGGKHGGGMGDNMRGGGDREKMMAKMKERLEQQHSHLEIYLDGLEFNVTDGLDITRLLYTDGREVTLWTERGEATAQALRSGDELEVRWQTRDGATGRIQRFRTSEDGQTLTVTDQMRRPNSEEFISLDLVYDRTQ